MSIVVSATNIGIPLVGTGGKLDWGSVQIQPTIYQLQNNLQSHIRLYNESGAGLQIVYSDQTDFIPAGNWRVFEVDPTQTTLTYTVIYSMPGPSVTFLILSYYGPGEEVPEVGPLGNSPIGVTGNLKLGNVQATDFTVLPTPGVGGNWDITNGGNVNDAIGITASSNAGFQMNGAGPNQGQFAFSNGSTTTFAGNGSGDLTFIAGITTTDFGVPIEVLDSTTIHVVTTGATTILTFTPSAIGTPSYRISGGVNANSSGGASVVTMTIAYNDIRNIARSKNFATTDLVALSAASLVTGDYPLIPLYLQQPNSSASVVITFTDTTATPNDRVRILVEQLS